MQRAKINGNLIRTFQVILKKNFLHTFCGIVYMSIYNRCATFRLRMFILTTTTTTIITIIIIIIIKL